MIYSHIGSKEFSSWQMQRAIDSIDNLLVTESRLNLNSIFYPFHFQSPILHISIMSSERCSTHDVWPILLFVLFLDLAERSSGWGAHSCTSHELQARSPQWSSKFCWRALSAKIVLGPGANYCWTCKIEYCKNRSRFPSFQTERPVVASLWLIDNNQWEIHGDKAF